MIFCTLMAISVDLYGDLNIKQYNLTNLPAILSTQSLSLQLSFPLQLFSTKIILRQERGAANFYITNQDKGDLSMHIWDIGAAIATQANILTTTSSSWKEEVFSALLFSYLYASGEKHPGFTFSANYKLGHAFKNVQLGAHLAYNIAFIGDYKITYPLIGLYLSLNF